MKKFKDSLVFSLYGQEYHVVTLIEGERVAIIVSSNSLYKPFIFHCIEDYKQHLSRHFQGLWKEKTNCRPCKEYSSVLNVLHNQFTYYAAILYDNYIQAGYSRQTYIKENRMSFKAIQYLL